MTSIGPVVVYAGKCEDALKAFPDASVDAIVTDPPYGLEFMGKDWDAPWKKGDVRQRGDAAFRAATDEKPFGRVRRGGTAAYRANAAETGRGFQRWCETWALECLRVLKPGGHMLCFGGTRTYHRLACGIEDAGFEIRDTIKVAGWARVDRRTKLAAKWRARFESVCWMYGSGFPKSLDVSKAIDAARGTEAKRYRGWGTALKPAWEPVVVARKPLEGTVARNVLKYGTGGINIDACRVRAVPGDETSNHARSEESGQSKGIYGDATAQDTHQTPGQALGRWPPNVVLVHHPGCRQVGERKTRSAGPFAGPRKSSGGLMNGTAAPRDVTPGYADPDGTETVTAWECVDGCAVAMIDRQSGKLSRGHHPKARGRGSRVAGASGHSGQTGLEERHAEDIGGASRFYPQFEITPADLFPARYVAKAARSEREEGLDALPERASRRNHHPTVKPVALVRWLARLVTPPGGTVLDPFAGSGTTLVAAVAEGFAAIGCEMTAEYLPIIEGRVRHAIDARPNPLPPA